MLISAELRWFWRAELPTDFKEWFLSSSAHPFPAGGGRERLDDYLNDVEQTELGIKARGGKPGVEVKGLIAQLPDALPDGPFKAPAELWTKWTSNALAVPANLRISTKKTRWLRKFDTIGSMPRELHVGADEEPIGEPRPAMGCNVELTQLTVDGKTVWTFGFEAFGEFKSVSDQLRAVADALAKRNPPTMGEVELASYPTWLARHAQKQPRSPASLLSLPGDLRSHLSAKISSIPPLQEILNSGENVEALAVMIAQSDLLPLLRHYLSIGRSSFDPAHKATEYQIADANWDTRYSELRKDLQLVVAAR